MSEFQVGQVVEFSQDGQSGEAPIKDVFDAGVVLHWRHPGGLEQWYALKENVRPAVPRPGDTVRVVGCDLQSVFTARGGVVGGEYTFQGTHDIDPTLVRLDFGNGGYFLLNLILLRRAGTPAAEEVRYYGTMPDPLPERIPAGVSICASFTVEKDLIRVYHDDVWQYRGQVRGAGGWLSNREAQYEAKSIHWSLVPVQPSPAAEVAKGWEPRVGDFVEGLTCDKSTHGAGVSVRGFVVKWREAPNHIALGLERHDQKPFAVIVRDSARLIAAISPPPVGSADNYLDCGLCGRQESPPFAPGDACPMCCEPMKEAGGGSSDPYAAVRELDTSAIHAMAHPRELPATPQTAMFISWQAKQRRHLEQAKLELDRPIRHPSDFECSDEPTNIWCNGRP